MNAYAAGFWMMKVEVLFFGVSHDLTGFGREIVDVPAGTTLEALRKSYEARFPTLKDMEGSILLAVNQEITPLESVLYEGDEVAFMPPVSGGADDDFYRITRERIQTQQLSDDLKRGEDGAVVVFEGIVRNNSQGRRTLYLEYEGYESMAIRKMEEIGREAKERFPIDRIGMIHRLGRMAIGETSVAIIVTSAHRTAAFDACRYAIDRLKQIVPIWKKEFFEDGAVWAEGEGQTRVLQEADKR